MILLLDIDGVMVQQIAWEQPTEYLEDGFPIFIPEATVALQRIMYELCPEIIISSSHKDVYSTEGLKSIFKLRGIDIPKLNKLPESKGYRRSEEIQSWYNTSKVIDNFLIVDDDSSLHGLPQELKGKWIQTQPHIGLTVFQAEDIIRRGKLQ